MSRGLTLGKFAPLHKGHQLVIDTALAEEFDTTWMPEYGHEYWEQHQVDRRLTLDQLVELAEGHLEREDALLLKARNTLFTDTNAITTAMFSLYYHGDVRPWLVELAEAAQDRYDVTFVCDVDIPYDDTWDRSGDMNRCEFQERILADLEARKVSFEILRGSIDERVAQVKRSIAGMRKY